MKQNMGQAEANELRPGALVCYWLLVPEAGLAKFEIRGPVQITSIKRGPSPDRVHALTPGHVLAVKLADSPCWVRREFLISNIHEA